MKMACLAAAAGSVLAGTAFGGLAGLSADMTVDNLFTASISTDPMSAGTTFLTGGSWPTTYSGGFNFDAPGTYYLQVRAEDVGRPAMFIGSFSLTGDATFSNGTSGLLTNADGDWTGSTAGYGGPATNVIDLGPNGTAPWGNFTAMGVADFIWVEGTPSPLVAYFTAVITVVPAPSALGVFAAAGLMAVRRRGGTG